jgi:pimeloyl-ACP methyl ester carboxylesterase
MLRKIAIALAVLLAAAGAVAIRPDLPIQEVEAAYKRPFSKFATLRDGTKLHYWDRGTTLAPVLVLLHGSYDSADTWEEWAPQLEKDFHLIVPDLPAHGLTGRTKADDYSAEQMANTLHELIEQLDVGRVHVAGNSMGGRVAWTFASAYPESVDRLVLVDSAGYPNPNTVNPTANNAFTRWLLRYGNPKRLIRQGFVRAVGESDEALITDLRVDRWTAYVRREGSRDAHRKRAEQSAAAKSGQDRIAKIQAPTLILWGDQDQLIPVAHAHFFERDLPDHQLILYEGVGHMPQLEIPERSANDVRTFLTSER